MENCDLCQNIPFEQLPSEEEDALPHQPSLDALELSAKTCSVCELIWWAAGCSLARPGGVVELQPNIALPSGRKVLAEFLYSNYTAMGHGLENGVLFSDDTSAKPDLRPPIYIDLRSHFPTGANIRPWLFGNWYKSVFDPNKLLLVGLGVRLGAVPGIEEAESNSKEKIRLHGTYLRIRTDDGTHIQSLLE
jgi:hypothetical protein